MKVSDIIRQALEKRGFKNLKDASKVLGISPELLRVTINKGHVPKDKTLMLIATKLGLDKSVLILSAHQQKVPAEVKGFFLSPAKPKYKTGKRRYPLSEEQIIYLEKILSQDEIQIIRKIRQMTEEGRIQATGYVEYLFDTKRVLS